MKFIKYNENKENLVEMATIGYFTDKRSNKPKGNRLKVFVTSDNGRPQAHVHIQNKTESKNICIKLDSPEYFIHSIYTDKLTKSEIDNLIDFFNSATSIPQRYFNGKLYNLRTQWDNTILQWYIENEDYYNPQLEIKTDEKDFIISPPMPDYRLLK